MRAAEFIAGSLEIYAAAGAVFAAAFVTFGVRRVDHVAEGAPFGFRLMIMPGVAALWPILLSRWIRSVKL